MRLKKTPRDVLFIGVPSVIVGLLAGLYLGTFAVATVKYEITVGEILNAVVTILLAMLVADFLSKRATNLRVEKDILLQECADVQRATAAAREFARKTRQLESTPEQRHEVLSLLADAFSTLETLETDLSHCQDSLGPVEIKPVRDGLLRYKAALTGGPFPQNPLDDGTYLESERKYNEYVQTLASLRFDVNRR